MIASSLLFIALASTLQDDEKWETVAPKGGGFAVEMPVASEQLGSIKENGPTGPILHHELIRQPGGVQYWVIWEENRSAIPRSAEKQWLNHARDMAIKRAGTYGGVTKIVSEKDVKTGPTSGREFVARIDYKQMGVTEVRGRVFVKGPSAYAVMASSQSTNKDFPARADRFVESFAFGTKPGAAAQAVAARGPEGEPIVAPMRIEEGGPMPFNPAGPIPMNGAGPMPRNGGAPGLGLMIPAMKLILGSGRTSLLLGTGRLVAAIASRPRPGPAMAGANPPGPMPGPTPGPSTTRPRPEPTRRAAPEPKAGPLKAWGTEVDPSGDVEIRASGKSLTMVIPGSPHVLAPERDIMNAPRVIAPVRGDFVATVRVDGAFDPSEKSTVKGLSSREAGGLILWRDSGNYLVFQRRASSGGDEGKEKNQAVLEELVGGRKGVTSRQAAVDGPVFLRIDRKKGRISASFSADGRQWKDLKPLDADWAAGDLQVGVVAVSTSTGPHPVTFEGYTLKAR